MKHQAYWDDRVCWCGVAHQPRERAVPCLECGWLTGEYERVCQTCWPADE